MYVELIVANLGWRQNSRHFSPESGVLRGVVDFGGSLVGGQRLVLTGLVLLIGVWQVVNNDLMVL